ncbi:glycine-rich domain-containing protein [Pseudomonas protegens]|uniref:glycine-rich domain-containing protein n=1 Tax=Pseudomonas protegens TaxID=380021 RepID=UPI001FF0B1DB|nr:hypothetical protein [Pseudomonas protegens]
MLLILPAVVALALILVFWRRQKALTALRREAHIRNFTLPPRLFEPLRTQHPHLNLKDCQLVAQGLRQFFLAYLKSGQRYVSMPSQVVDDLWHEFILHTRDYQQFCNQAFGQFLHHTPAAVLGQNAAQQSDNGLRRVWRQACLEENINPAQPSRLPLLSPPPPSLPPLSPSPPKRELSLSLLLPEESLSRELLCSSLPQCTRVALSPLSVRRRRDWQSAT